MTEEQFLRILRANILEWRDKFVGSLVRGEPLGTAEVYRMRARLDEGIDAEFTEEMAKMLSEYQAATFKDGVEKIDAMLRGEGLEDVLRLPASTIDVAKSYDNSVIKTVMPSMLEELKKAVTLAYLGQRTPAEIAKRIEAITGTATYRAETIVRTEGKKLQNAGERARIVTAGQAGERLGIPMVKTWIHSSGSRRVGYSAPGKARAAYVPRLHHKAMHGEEVAPGEKFKLVDPRTLSFWMIDGPHDPVLPAGEVVNCYCDTGIRINTPGKVTLRDVKDAPRPASAPKPRPASPGTRPAVRPAPTPAPAVNAPPSPVPATGPLTREQMEAMPLGELMRTTFGNELRGYKDADVMRRFTMASREVQDEFGIRVDSVRWDTQREGVFGWHQMGGVNGQKLSHLGFDKFYFDDPDTTTKVYRDEFQSKIAARIERERLIAKRRIAFSEGNTEMIESIKKERDQNIKMIREVKGECTVLLDPKTYHEAAAFHETLHAVDRKNDYQVSVRFERILNERNLKFRTTEYAGYNIKELFAEAGTCIRLGLKIPKAIVKAYEEAVSPYRAKAK